MKQDVQMLAVAQNTVILSVETYRDMLLEVERTRVLLEDLVKVDKYWGNDKICTLQVNIELLEHLIRQKFESSRFTEYNKLRPVEDWGQLDTRWIFDTVKIPEPDTEAVTDEPESK